MTSRFSKCLGCEGLRGTFIHFLTGGFEKAVFPASVVSLAIPLHQVEVRESQDGVEEEPLHEELCVALV